MVYVIDFKGDALMPTERHGKIKHLLRQKRAIVVKAKPFTVQLLYESTFYVQPVELGVDTGYKTVGFSAVTEEKEVLSGELTLLQGQAQRMKERSSYRKQRRSGLRHRKCRFDNRHIPKGWLAPSMKNKLDTHVTLVNNAKKILPISKVTIEVGNFDIQAIKNPDISGKEYQQGEQSGFWNLREYILHRDHHTCQNPQCKHKKSNPKYNYIKEGIPLQVHHIGFWKNDGSDRPSNLITLCIHCHTPANHKKGKLLDGWKPTLNSFRPETFMSIIRWYLKDKLQCDHTYGYKTKSKRIELKIPKTHYNDAFCIAGGNSQKRIEPIMMQQVRRNNRSLESFYDSQFIDMRTGEKTSGGALFSGRRKRNKNLNTENLRIYRGQRLSKGRVSIRKKRYSFQPQDVVIYQNKKCVVVGIQNKGEYIKLKNLAKPVKTSLVKIKYYSKGLSVI